MSTRSTIMLAVALAADPAVSAELTLRQVVDNAVTLLIANYSSANYDRRSGPRISSALSHNNEGCPLRRMCLPWGALFDKFAHGDTVRLCAADAGSG